MLRTLFALVLTAAFGFAQPAAAPLQLTLVDGLMPYIGDPAIQKELGLTPEQTEKLLAARKKDWDAVYQTAPKDLKYEELSKANEATLQAVLSPEQMARAKQLAAQELWTNFTRGTADRTLDFHRAPCGVLRNYPEMAAALTLDDTQKKAVETMTGGGFAPMGSIYLTAAQSEAAKALMGAPYKGTFRMEVDPRNRGFGRNTMSAKLRYTVAPDVKKELAITAEQTAALDELRNKFPAGGFGGPGGGGGWDQTKSPAELAKADEELQAEVTAGMEKILTAEQRSRLDQIAMQQISTRPETLFAEANPLGTALGVTEEQRKALAALQEKLVAATVKLVLSNDPIEKVKAAVADLDANHAKAVDGLLTYEQRTKKAEVLGKPFTARTFGPTGPGGRPGIAGGPTARQRELSFGKYTTELGMLARGKPLHDELKMTEDQVKKVTDLAAKVLEKFPTRDITLGTDEVAKKMIAERSEFVEKALADVLDKAQLARFREISLQQIEALAKATNASNTPFRVTFRTGGVVAYPGVAEAIKLTEEQRKKLFAGTKTDDVLTDEQKAAIQKMLGEKADLAKLFPQPTGPTGPRGFGPGGFPARPALEARHFILLDSQLWDELKLTPAQIDKLAPAGNTYTVAMQSASGFGGPGGGFDARTPAFDVEKSKAAVDAFALAADGVLTDTQKTRAAQLAIQKRAASSLQAVLATSQTGATDAFNVSPEQVTRMTAIGADMNERVSLLNRRGFGGPVNTNQPRNELRDRLDAMLMKELTPDQLAKWKEMTGEPYAGFVKTELSGFGGGFGGGGFGVGDGFGGGNPFAQ